MPNLIGSSFAIIIFVGCAVALLMLLKSNPSRPGAPPEPVPAQAEPVSRQFLTEREAAMLVAIEQILPGHRIHAQVSMGALLRALRPDGRKVSAADRNSFSQKIVDFVVQDRSSGSVIALIEVDDSSHVARRDRQRDAMTQRAGYTTIRIPARARAALPDVQLALAPLLQSRASALTAADRQAGDA